MLFDHLQVPFTRKPDAPLPIAHDLTRNFNISRNRFLRQPLRPAPPAKAFAESRRQLLATRMHAFPGFSVALRKCLKK